MNKKNKVNVLEKLVPVIEKVTNATEKTIKAVTDFLKSQTPELAKEIIRWEIVDSGIMFVAGMILVCISFFKLNTVILFSEKWYTQSVQIFLIILGSGIMLSSTDWIKPLVAPRLFLLEWLKNNIKR